MMAKWVSRNRFRRRASISILLFAWLIFSILAIVADLYAGVIAILNFITLGLWAYFVEAGETARDMVAELARVWRL